jgi:hypothetical protein
MLLSISAAQVAGVVGMILQIRGRRAHSSSKRLIFKKLNHFY